MVLVRGAYVIAYATRGQCMVRGAYVIRGQHKLMLCV